MNFRTESVFRVGGALLFGGVLVLGAFMFGHESAATSTAGQPAAIRAVDADVRTALRSVDTDGDGIPDWEEELRGTDPHTPTILEEETATTTTEAGASAAEPYESPSTLTDQFAEEFLEEVVRQSAGRELTKEEQTRLVTESISSLVQSGSDRLYTRADVTLHGRNDLAAFREYGNSVSAIIERHSLNNEHELAILQRAVDTDNAAVLREIAPIEAAYRNMLRDLLALPAPSDMAKAHIDLANTFSIIANGLDIMQRAFDDPLAALVRAKRYPDDAAGLFYALDNIRMALEAKGIVYTNDEPGIFLFSLRP